MFLKNKRIIGLNTSMVFRPYFYNKKTMEKKFKFITATEELSSKEKEDIVNFLYRNLEQYSDSKENIAKALKHIFSKESPTGGFILLSYHYLDISGAVIVNRTGMDGYIPENILVYIAVRKDLRGMGLGKMLMQKIIESTDGDIALHVESKNPAQFLYSKLGFKNKYLEMRLTKK